MRRTRLTLMLVFVAAAFHLTWYSLMWIRLAEDAGGYESTDFRVFYTAGRLVRIGHFSDFYDLDLQYDFQVNYFNVTFDPANLLTFNHPPILIPIQAMIFSENYAASYWRWAVFMILLLAGCSVFATRLLLSSGWKFPATVVAVLGWLLFYPVFISVLKGQDTALLLLGGIIWLYGLLSDKEWLAGLGLALTTVRPQVALALAIPFLFNRRKIWWWFCAGASLLIISSVAMIGWRGVEGFVQVLLVSARGEGYGIGPAAMFNFIGILLRFFPGANEQVVNILTWIVYILAIFLLSFIWWKNKKVEIRQIILAIPLCVFTAPHLHYHDLSLLLLGIFGIMIDGVERGILPSKIAMLFPLSISFLMVLADVTIFRFWGPYILMLILVLWPWLSFKIQKMCPWLLAGKV